MAEGELQLHVFLFSFNAIFFFPHCCSLIFFLVLVRKFFLFSFVVFATFVNANPKKTRTIGVEEHVVTKLANGIGGVMSEGGFEGWKM